MIVYFDSYQRTDSKCGRIYFNCIQSTLNNSIRLFLLDHNRDYAGFFSWDVYFITLLEGYCSCSIFIMRLNVCLLARDCRV
jgi:hypothetical protein